jgi:predicted RNase H-like HicB family nuclease
MQLAVALNHEDPWYVARCLDVEVASQSGSLEEAHSNLKEALELFFEDEVLPEELEPPIIATVRLPAWAGRFRPPPDRTLSERQPGVVSNRSAGGAATSRCEAPTVGWSSCRFTGTWPEGPWNLSFVRRGSRPRSSPACSDGDPGGRNLALVFSLRSGPRHRRRCGGSYRVTLGPQVQHAGTGPGIESDLRGGLSGKAGVTFGLLNDTVARQ